MDLHPIHRVAPVIAILCVSQPLIVDAGAAVKPTSPSIAKILPVRPIMMFSSEYQWGG